MDLFIFGIKKPKIKLKLSSLINNLFLLVMYLKMECLWLMRLGMIGIKDMNILMIFKSREFVYILLVKMSLNAKKIDFLLLFLYIYFLFCIFVTLYIYFFLFYY